MFLVKSGQIKSKNPKDEVKKYGQILKQKRFITITKAIKRDQILIVLLA